MGTRIATALTLDGAGFDRVLTQEEAKANGFAARMNRLGVGLLSGKSAAASGSAIDEIMKAQEKLKAFRFAEATSAEKIRTITSQLRTLAVERSHVESGTAAHARLQLEHEEKLVKLRALQQSHQAGRLSGRPEEFDRFEAEQKLASFRRQSSFNEASTVGKIKIVTSELRDLSLARAKTEAGSAASLGLQLQMEEKLVKLRALQRQQAAYNVGGGSLPGGGAGPGGMTADVMRTLNRKFGLGDALKGLLAGFALGSVDSVSEKIAELVTGGSKEGFEKLEEYADREKELIQKRVDVYLTASRRVEDIEQRLAKARAEVGSSRKTTTVTTRPLFTPAEPITVAAFTETEQEFSLRIAKAKDEARLLEVEQAQAEASAREHKRTMDDLQRQPGSLGDNESARMARLSADATRDILRSRDRKLSGGERDAAEQRAQERLNERAKLEYEVARTRLRSAEQLADIERERLALGETTEEHIARLKSDAESLDARAAISSRTVAEQESDRAAAATKRFEAERMSLQYAIQQAAIADHMRDIDREVAALGETTGEQILRLREEAVELQERSADLARTEAQRDADRVGAAEKRAKAAQLEYSWRNKALTVSEAASPTASGRRNTTSVGTAARQIQFYDREATRARREGRYDAAEHYDSLARSATEAFDVRDRNARRAAQQRAIDAAEAKKNPWDERWGQALAERDKRLDVRNREAFTLGANNDGGADERGVREDMETAGSDLSAAAADLSAAADELRNIEVEIDAT